MELHKYTQKEFDALPENECGGKICPTGDYTAIVSFPPHSELGNICTLGNGCKLGNFCKLGNGCKLGNDCTLGVYCTLGDKCTLGDECTLGNFCKLGNGCKLGNFCKLGNICTLGNGCKLGNFCKLGNICTLGDKCTLGDECKLGNGCELGYGCKLGETIGFENGAVRDGSFTTVKNIGSEKREAYFYRDKDGKFFVRAGCWFSGMEEFKVRVHEVHGGTAHEAAYLAACDYAMTMLNAYAKEGEHAEL